MLAFLFPITLDGLILAGSLLILYFAVRGKRSGYGLFLTALGVLASIAGNVVISPHDLTYQILHATSPVVLFLSLESLMILLRARSRNAIEAAEKEAADKKLHDDSYFIHKDAHEPSKTVEVKPATTAPEPVDTRPVVAPKPIVSALPKKEEAKPVNLPKAVEIPEPAPVTSPSMKEEEVKVVPAEVSKDSTVENPIEEPFEETITTPVVAKQEVIIEKPVELKTEAVAFDGTQPPSKREIIRELLLRDPEMEAGEIVDIVGGDKKYVQKLIRAERAKIAA